MGERRYRVVGSLVVGALLATSLSLTVAPSPIGATDAGNPPPAVASPSATPAQTRAPNAIAVIGDSISAGTGAAGTVFSAGSEQPQVSWATGTENGLNSLYQRLLSVNPSASGGNYNMSSNGKLMRDAPGQASSLPTNTEYVVIQMGGNDLCRPSEAEMTTVATYRTEFVRTLDALASRVPNAHIFVASIPDIYNLWYLRGSSFSTSSWAGLARTFWDNGLLDIIPCKSLLASPTSNSSGDNARRNRVRQRGIDLNNVLAQECAKVLRCRFDDFATFNFSSNRVWSGPGQAPNSAPLKPSNQWVFTDGDISTIDHFHPSFGGHQKLASEGAKASYDWTENTPPAVTTTVDRSAEASGTIALRATATDADGVKGLQYRVHPVSATPTGWTSTAPTGWTSVVGDSVSVPVGRLTPAFVEVRALDRNGNLSAGSLEGVFPAPGAPSGPTFRQQTQNGVEGMRVNWGAPSDERLTRGSVAPTIAYEVTASPGGQTCRTQAVSLDPVDLANIETGCLVSGLTYGQTYSFTVRAITQGGPGARATARLGTLSGPTTAAFIGPSGPVTNLSVSPEGSSLVVRWAPPTDLGGGPLKGYEVKVVRRGSGLSATTLCGTTQVLGQAPVYYSSSQCTLRNAVPLADYDFEVRAITEIDTSPFTTKPTLVSVAEPVSGWLPETPVLQGVPTASMAVVGRIATVTWPRLSASQLAPSTTVTVTAQPGGAICTVPAEMTSCEIPGLSPLVSYTFTVVVNNGVGTASGSASARLVIPANAVPAFTDIKPDNFAAVPARWLLANGVTTGIDAASTKFGPTQNVTRGQLSLFLWRLEGRRSATVPCGVTDVTGASSGTVGDPARAVCWMKQAAISTSSTYRPTANLTRGDMALFLWRLEGKPASSASCGFSDVTRLGDTGRAACWLRTVGVIDPKATYSPNGLVTRGQMAKFLYNIANLPA